MDPPGSGSPNAKIVVGGSAVNVSPADTFACLEADYALGGEGEEALANFLRALAEATPLARVHGCSSPARAARRRCPFWTRVDSRARSHPQVAHWCMIARTLLAATPGVE